MPPFKDLIVFARKQCCYDYFLLWTHFVQNFVLNLLTFALKRYYQISTAEKKETSKSPRHDLNPMVRTLTAFRATHIPPRSSSKLSSPPTTSSANPIPIHLLFIPLSVRELPPPTSLIHHRSPPRGLNVNPRDVRKTQPRLSLERRIAMATATRTRRRKNPTVCTPPTTATERIQRGLAIRARITLTSGKLRRCPFRNPKNSPECICMSSDGRVYRSKKWRIMLTPYYNNLFRRVAR